MRKFLVTIEGKQYEVGVEELGVTASVPQVTEVKTVAPAVSAPAQAKPAPAPVQPKQTQAPANGTKVEAPMPGMIKSFKVSEGATVKEGDVILVFEAMKMDNDITAPCDGVVSFATTVGSNVETGDVIAIIS